MKSIPSDFRQRVVDDARERFDLGELIVHENLRRAEYRQTVAALLDEHVGADDLRALHRHGCTGHGSGLVVYPPGHVGRDRNYRVGGDGGGWLRWAPLPPNGRERFSGWEHPADLVYPSPWNPIGSVARCVPAAVDDALYPLAVECEANAKARDAIINGHENALRDALAKCRTIVEAERVWPGTAKLWAAWRERHPEYGRPRIDWDTMIERMREVPVGWTR